MQNLPTGTRSSTVPGKTYEYLASGRPILAAIPDGDARDILAAAGNSRLAYPSDVSAMADAIEDEVSRWLGTEPRPVPDPSVVARFERRLLTKELAAVLDAVTALPTTPALSRSQYAAERAAI